MTVKLGLQGITKYFWNETWQEGIIYYGHKLGMLVHVSNRKEMLEA